MINTWSSPSRTSPPPNNPTHPPSTPNSMTTPPPPPTFTTVIDADHAAINAAALALSRLLLQPSPATTTNHSPLPLLHELTWRLIRHDLSEELIMRPAFITHLGPVHGTQAANDDRDDHERARVTLRRLYAAFQRCAPHDTQTRQQLTNEVLALMRELAEHMRRESGEELPALERRLGRRESEELGRRYEETLVVEPGLVVGGRRVWRDVEEYVGAGKGRFLEVWGEVKREQESMERERERGKEGGRRRDGKL